jgi:hypothetical protein
MQKHADYADCHPGVKGIGNGQMEQIVQCIGHAQGKENNIEQYKENHNAYASLQSKNFI